MCLGVLLSPCDIHQGNCTSEPELSLIVGVQRLDYRLQRITSLNLYLFGINMSYLLEAQRRLGVKDKGKRPYVFFCSRNNSFAISISSKECPVVRRILRHAVLMCDRTLKV